MYLTLTIPQWRLFYASSSDETKAVLIQLMPAESIFITIEAVREARQETDNEELRLLLTSWLAAAEMEDW